MDEGSKSGREEPRVRPSWNLSRWIFLRILGLVYLAAFLSLWWQLDGLIGASGILPAAELLKAVEAQVGSRGAWLLPSMCWWDPSDRFLHWLCAGGAVSALLLLCNIAPALSGLAAWAIYLSLVNVGQDFMSFQWDMLLLEAGLLAVFLAPWRLWPRLRLEPEVQSVARWMVWWLLFRLMLGSGAVKLQSGDPTWWSLTALEVHYETQPLPTWIGWYAHQLPSVVQRACGLGMFLIELGLPFLIFVRGRPRLVAAAGMALLQVLIAATGNYCFFNLLSLALILSLLPDSAVLRWFPRMPWGSTERPRAGRLHRWCTIAAAIPILALSGLQAAGQAMGRRELPEPAQLLLRWASPVRSVNSYGLFAVMTTERREIVVEGSQDGTTWKEYEFRWKPGDPERAPGFVAPHQPRLDWQMWFAALGSYESNEWFLRFLVQLLRGSPSVLELLGKNPFPETPPRFVRGMLYRYRFTSLSSSDSPGAWWKREPLGLYCPALSLREEAR